MHEYGGRGVVFCFWKEVSTGLRVRVRVPKVDFDKYSLRTVGFGIIYRLILIYFIYYFVTVNRVSYSLFVVSYVFRVILLAAP